MASLRVSCLKDRRTTKASIIAAIETAIKRLADLEAVGLNLKIILLTT